MKKRQLTQDEIRQIQLLILQEIDRFCRTNNITYSLAFGTALGAVRHHGFIPWDDDVDIIMPLSDMRRFKELFQSRTLRYHDIDTNPEHGYQFSRISYLPTYRKEGLIASTYGVNIDLYPVVGLPKTMKEVSDFFECMKKPLDRLHAMIKWRSRLVRILPITTIPGYTACIRKFRDTVLDAYPYEQSNLYYHAGSMRMVNVLDFDVFEDLIDADFEGLKLQIPARYHDYLSHCFGDYMELPPVEDRHPSHGLIYYWR